MGTLPEKEAQVLGAVVPKIHLRAPEGVGGIYGEGNMAYEEAPLHLVVTIRDGLIDDDMGLGAAVIVEVAPHRRNPDNWPTVMVGALVVAPDMPIGVPAVWAAGEEGTPIHPVDGAAREFWAGTPDAVIDLDEFPRYPEAEEARRRLPDHS
jgi:hypothetical protein